MTLNIYRFISIALTIIFAIVGIVFLCMSDGVLVFFNRISIVIGMEQVEPLGEHFYLILAVAYMYLVALLAFLMYRDPNNAVFPLLLFNAKAASSAISFLLFIVDRHFLIYITNGVVDGFLAILVFVMYRYAKNLPPFRKRLK